MKKSKSVGDRLKVIKLQSNLNKQNIPEKPQDDGGTNFEEYPKLRKPKPATLLKIKAHQRKSDSVAMPHAKADAGGNEDDKNLQVPLRQEFLNKKEQIEKATSNFLKKYEMRKSQGRLLDDDIFSQESDEAQPLTLHNELDLKFNELDLTEQATNKNIMKVTKDSAKSLNYLEQHLVNMLYTKVQAHANGFFASNLPLWYKKTFDKDLPSGWLELLERSHKFYIEEVQNKIVLYTKEINNEDTIDLNSSGDHANTTMKKTNSQEIHPEKSIDRTNINTESSVGFVRYKHLQKSIHKYAAQNAGRDMPYASKSNENFIKPIDRLNKAAVINKKYSFVKK
ncbi:uncharacterized protein LOC135956578 [Calliphora vicina]|uniref:uncharacterized protein LOC135956578 n=1 Tax=Calliphora vicina TaxID=7373 RepID=UPI00325A9758